MDQALAVDATASWHAVHAADPNRMSRADLSQLYGHLERVRSACDAVEVMAVRRGRELNQAGAAEAPEAVLARETGRSARDARVAAQRETACASVPEFQAALAAGDMSAGHVDAAAFAMKGLDEAVADQFAELGAELVGRAGKLGVDAFERECRDLARYLRTTANDHADVDELERQRQASSVKRWVDRHTGMHNTLLSLDPLRDSAVWKVINAELAGQRRRNQQHGVADIGWHQLQADAVVAAITNVGNGSAAERVPEVGILIDWQVLATDAVVAGVCETVDGIALPVATVRRLCCDALVYPAVLGTDGEVLDQGRATRTATRPQRRALATMHRSCASPGCTVAFDTCRIHHVDWWWRDLGPTDIDNLLPLCERHHHLVHEGGWTLTMTVDRIATWTRPDGTMHHRGSTIDRSATAPAPPDRRPTNTPSTPSTPSRPMLC